MILLVNAPSGVQELIEIELGGGYFDVSRVLWDEREDGPLPEITLGGMVRVGDGLAYSQDRMDEHNEASKPPVPQSVTMRQARLILLQDRLLGLVDPAIDALPEPQRSAARIEWEYSQEVQRYKEFVLMLAPALGLDDAGLDSLFTRGAKL